MSASNPTSNFELTYRPEFLQPTPDVATLADGGFVAVWQSQYQDKRDFGIFGQRYDADGNRVGGEFLINTNENDDQDTPSVAALADGGFVVTWQSRDFGGTEYDIFFQRYDANGALVGTETLVNTTVADFQEESKVIGLQDGGFLITWRSAQQDLTEESGGAFGVFAQRYDANSNPVGVEFQVNSTVERNQADPAAASLNDGGFVIVWQSLEQDGNEYGIYGQQYNSDGDRVGGEFQINTTTIGSQNQPSIATLDNGDFVVSWNSYGQDGSGYGVFAQRFDGNANPIGSEFQVNTSTAANQQTSDIAALDNGGFVISWRSQTSFDGDYQVFAREYNADGTPVGEEFQINSLSPTQDRGTAAVTGLADGGFTAIWHSLSPEGKGESSYLDNYRVYGQVYDGDGNAVNEQFEVSTFVLDIPVFEPQPPTGDLTITIAASDTDPIAAAQADFVAQGTNDQALINLAVEQIFDAGGGTVKLLPGVFNVSGNVLVRSNVNLEGSGWRSVIRLADESTLDLAGIVRSKRDTPFSADIEIHNSRLADFQIDGNRDNQTSSSDKYGVYGAFTDSIFEDLYIRNTSSYGFDPHENSRNGAATLNLTVRNNIVENAGLDGITLDKVRDSLIEGNLAYNNDRHGINLVSEAEYTGLFDNVAVGNGGNGITVQTGSRKLDIANNEFVSNDLNGIYVPEEGVNVIRDNLVRSNGNYGINLRRSSGNLVQNNLVFDNSQSEHDRYSEIEINDDGLVYATFNTVTDNVVRSSLDNRARYGVNEKSPGDDFNTITGNIIVGPVRGDASIEGPNSVYVPGTGLTILSANDDSIQGSENVDRISAELGNDTLFGWAGDDILWGGAGDDSIEGGLHDDNLSGDAGNDTLIGGDGDDGLDGGDGNDSLAGGLDPDSLYGRSGNDTLAGGEGDDYLWGGRDEDLLQAGMGNDYLNGEAGDDTLEGGLGDDFLDGSDGNDSLTGNAGDDLLKGGTGADTLDGGNHNDYLDGGDGDDILLGGDGDDVIESGAGRDILQGQGGNDILRSGEGRDRLIGGAGDDAINLGDDLARDVVQYAAGDGSDVLINFDLGEDTFAITGVETVDIVVGGADTQLRLGGGVEFGTGEILFTLKDIQLDEESLAVSLDEGNRANYRFSEDPNPDRGQVLFVVDDQVAPDNADVILQDYLEQEGYRVTLIDDNVARTVDTFEKDLVLVSKSVSSSAVEDELLYADVPLITWKHELFDDAGFTERGNDNRQRELNQTQIQILDPDHPLAAGFEDLVNVYSAPKSVTWGRTGGDVIEVASVVGNPALTSIFGYEAESALIDGTVTTQRRVGFFLDKTVSVTEDALTLFDAAVTWATDDPFIGTLSLDFAELDIEENGGKTTATVQRVGSTAGDLTVFLSSKAPMEAVPTIAEVTIPDGEVSASFTIEAVDDFIADGAQTAAIAASAAGFETATKTLRVLDDETPQLSLEFNIDQISEALGNVTATLTRNTDGQGDLLVELTGSDATRVSFPDTVTIPDGATETSFTSRAIDNDLLDGDAVVTLSATADGFISGSDSLEILDDDPALALNTNVTRIVEGQDGAVVTVSRNTGSEGDLLVELTSSDPGALTIPATVTIPDGATSVDLDAIAVDETAVDGLQSVSITATATGLETSTIPLEIADNDGASVLLVVGSTNLGGGDRQLQARLQEGGYNVILQDDDALVGGDFSDVDLVAISKSVSTGKVGDIFTDAATPVLSLASNLFDDLDLTGRVRDNDYGNLAGQQNIDILSPGHPLAAGLSGSVAVYTEPRQVGWGVPAEDAIEIASLPGDGSRSSFFAYAAGATLVSGAEAPEKRLGLFLDNTTQVTEEALTLFDAAVDWAI